MSVGNRSFVKLMGAARNMLQKMTAYFTSVFSVLVLVGVPLRGEDQAHVRVYLRGETRTQPSDQQVFTHRLPRVDWIRTTRGGEFRGLVLQIAVDEHGTVTSAQVKEGPDEFREAALSLAKSWKYRPFERDGKPQAVILTDHLLLLPPERPARMNVPFPTVHDWASVTISLRRTRCRGYCPSYELWIGGNGDVLFEGTFPKVGEQHGNVSREDLKRLLDAFRAVHYYGLDREYKINGTDLPACITSISIDGQSMSVLDYGGLQVGMPTSVRDLESAIDEVVGTRKWLRAGEGR
jgi:hypothetical protein